MLGATPYVIESRLGLVTKFGQGIFRKVRGTRNFEEGHGVTGFNIYYTRCLLHAMYNQTQEK